MSGKIGGKPTRIVIKLPYCRDTRNRGRKKKKGGKKGKKRGKRRGEKRLHTDEPKKGDL